MWDVGIHASMFHSFAPGISDYSAGISIGRRLITNSWVSVGYNPIGFADRDFTAAGYTAQGPFIQFRLKFDQESAREIARALGLGKPDTAVQEDQR